MHAHETVGVEPRGDRSDRGAVEEALLADEQAHIFAFRLNHLDRVEIDPHALGAAMDPDFVGRRAAVAALRAQCVQLAGKFGQATVRVALLQNVA